MRHHRAGRARRRRSGRLRLLAMRRRNRSTATSAHRSIRASRSTTSSSASPTTWPSPPPGGVAEPDAPPFNPLFLYGGVGLGKTHLMHAIAWQIRAQTPRRKVVYLSAEKFMYQFIKALRFKDTMSFKELFRSADVLMVDDVQFIGGKESTQEEFFHTFNALADRGRQIVMSARIAARRSCRGWRSASARGSAGAWSPTFSRPPTSCAWASCSPRRRSSPARPGFPTTSWPSSPIASPRTCASWRAR